MMMMEDIKRLDTMKFITWQPSCLNIDLDSGVQTHLHASLGMTDASCSKFNKNLHQFM